MTQVHIDEINTTYDYNPLGVVTASPDTFFLPTDFMTPDPAVLCVCHNELWRFGQLVSFDIVMCLSVDGCLLAGLVPW